MKTGMRKNLMFAAAKFMAIAFFLSGTYQSRAAAEDLGDECTACLNGTGYFSDEFGIAASGPDEDDYFGPRTLFRWTFGSLEMDDGDPLDEPLVTDRPDFTESSSTVGRGIAQLEMGYSYTYDEEDDTSVRSHSYPETLLRVGVFAEWLELRIGWNYAEERTTVDNEPAFLRGSEDMSVGLKFALTPQSGVRPAMAIIAQMQVPTGSGDFTADEVLPGIGWFYSWDLNDCVSLAGGTQAHRAVDDSGHLYTELAQSLSIAYSLSDRWGAFTEWYVLIPHSASDPGTKPEYYFDGGFTYLLTDNLQYDVFAGFGLNRAADDYFTGTGLSYRY